MDAEIETNCDAYIFSGMVYSVQCTVYSVQCTLYIRGVDNYKPLFAEITFTKSEDILAYFSDGRR